mmetsp:Transcript_8699/g.13772  ORF Transcript_8699/g.13772 Transcript_8699/m.13772 type:complete len:99 (-) Transcript_8699:723-1019(-)
MSLGVEGCQELPTLIRPKGWKLKEMRVLVGLQGIQRIIAWCPGRMGLPCPPPSGQNSDWIDEPVVEEVPIQVPLKDSMSAGLNYLAAADPSSPSQVHL